MTQAYNALNLDQQLKPGQERQYTPQELLELAKCFQDPVYFCNTYCYLVTLDEGLTRKPLYPYQETLIKSAISNNFTICKLPRQALALSTLIPTPSGFKTLESIRPGDTVYDENGQPCLVLYESDIFYSKPVYKITFDDGTEVLASDDHLWTVCDRLNQKITQKNKKRTNTEHRKLTLTTKQIVESHWCSTTKKNHTQYAYYIPNTKPVNFPSKLVQIDPYLLGLWLGDGYSDSGVICGLPEHLEFYKQQLPNEVLTEFKSAGKGRVQKTKIEGLSKKLSYYNLRRKRAGEKTKRIPEEYLFNDIQTRIAVLQGIMDTDGFISKSGRCSIQLTNKNEPLINDIYKLLCSLGIKASKKYFERTNSTRISWSIGRSEFDCFRISYKLERQKQTLVSDRYVKSRTIQNIELTESVPTKCIKVSSPSNLFLCSESFVPTHNSGKTQSVALLITWLILFNDNYTVGVVAQNEKTAKEILKRVKTAYEHLPDFLKKAATSWNETSIGLENGSTVRVSGTSSASARGGSFNFLYLDEFAFVPEYIQKEFYESTMPTIAAGKTGRVLITSTPRGLNLFYKIWKESELGLNDFERIAIEWFDVPGRDEEWRIKQIRLMGQESFDQEYQTDFIGSSNTLISPQKLRALVHAIPLSQANGLDIYSLPAADRLYLLSADVARGVSLDYSAFTVIDITSWPYRVVAKYQSNKINSIQYAQLIVNVATNYNSAYCLVEINDIGQEIVDIMFNDFNYTNLFAHHTKNKNKQVDAGFAEDGQSKLGIRTTRLVKRLGCNRLKNLIESDKLIVEDYHIIEQLSKFVQKQKSYEADDGHDDLVMSLVLFGWLVDTPLFQRMTEASFRRDLLKERENDARNQINVFGFKHTGIEDYIPFKAPIEQKTVPFYDWTNPEWGTKTTQADPVMDDLEAQFFFGQSQGFDTKSETEYPFESNLYKRQRK